MEAKTTNHISLSEALLVVMHPHLQHSPRDPDFPAKFLHQFLLLPRHPPPEFLRKLTHPLLLLLAKSCPRSLPSATTYAAAAAAVVLVFSDLVGSAGDRGGTQGEQHLGSRRVERVRIWGRRRLGRAGTWAWAQIGAGA